ncbi:cytochrome P450 [Apiospora hydei]|uniref:Cytochrome P450 n=1 Tax=Apiospora hydei TaxID=1337664 RepID=A0ABR1WDZ0_9PEZI
MFPGAKMYIVTSPSLVTACDRRAKTVSFAPYVVASAKRILAAGEKSVCLLSEDLLEDKGPVTLRPETMKVMQQFLRPGESLDHMMKTMLKSSVGFLDTHLARGAEVTVPLFSWVRRFVGITSTNVAYGSEQNPMKDPSVSDDFWKVDKEFAFLGLNIVPDIIAPAANRGRKRFFAAFKEYYATGSIKNAAPFIHERYGVNTKHGVSDEDIAHFDLGVCTALLVNTVPAVWWVLYHVFSDPSLLHKVRRGIEDVAFDHLKSPTAQERGLSTTTISIQHVIKDFPLLESLIKEVLRVHSNSMSARYILQDTIVTDEDGTVYLLKKDSLLAMPSGPVHANRVAWGQDAETFDPSRFLGSSQRNSTNRSPASSYRAFGGGNALCPGRHFAMNEMMSILVIMTLRYNITHLRGKWRMPKTRNHVSMSVQTPAEDLQVRITARDRAKFLAWEFIW